MAELFTYRPKMGIGKDLREEELKEFNSITYDKIINMTDMNKLMRLEQYMREEEFTQTSQLARKRIVELGGKDMFPNELDPQFCDTDAEFNEFMKNFDTWQESMKEADNNLLEMHDSKQEEQPSMTVEPLLVQRRKRSNDETLIGSTNEKIPTKQPKKKKDIRSGRSYYEQWDKYATCAEKEIEADEKEAEKKVKEKKTKDTNTLNKETTKKQTLQQRLLAIGKSKSMTEREWFAEREREKGNDLFKAREYTASIDAYNMAIELFPKSPLAYGNRAASNIKLKKWEEVVKDCCIAIELDSKYMKAYMRRGLANLEMENPQEAMIDLNNALELDPKNQETQTIIRRAQFMLKKLKEKHAIEVELDRKRKEEAELQERKKEMEVFQNMTYSSPPSQNRTRMIIEEVEDSNVAENLKVQECKSTDENDIANETDTSNDTSVSKLKENKLQSNKIFNWPNRPHKHRAQFKSPQKIDDNIVKSMEDKSNCKSIAQNIINKNDTSGITHDHQFEKLDNNVNEEESVYSKLCDVEVPPEIIEAMKTHESIPKDHVAFGRAPNKHQQSSVCKSNSKVDQKPHLKACDDMLAEEWRLNGNTYFSQGKFHDAAECYTTSLKYQKSVAAYSNRAISRIKLKNFRGAEEDATHAISIDCKFPKAYYRRGLARRALGNFQGAKVDFEEVLRLTPNDEEVIKQLASIDSKYIPMRSGPMIIEEIKEDKEFVETTIYSSPLMKNDNNNSFNDLNDDTKNIDRVSNNSTSQCCSVDVNIDFCQINHVVNKFDELIEINNVTTHLPSTISTQEANDNQIAKNASTNNSQNHHIVNSDTSYLETKSSQSTEDIFINESNINNSTTKNAYKEKLEHRAKEEQEKGNKCFKKKQYTLAIECYTRSLQFVPTNANILANRALCFINLHQYQQALKDSIDAIQIAPDYIKAYHRRAVAAYKLGDFENALKDYHIVAKFLPNDKKLQRDIKDLESQIQSNANINARFSTAKISQPILTSEVCEKDDIILKPIKTTIYKNENKTPTMQQENVQLYSSIKNVRNNDKSFVTNEDTIKDNSAIKMAPLEVLNNIEKIKKTIPQKPISALEFERVCNSLKENPNLAREYVKSIETYKYPMLFKESLSASIIQCFIHILRKGFMPNDPMGAVDVLYGLTKIKRFSLILLLVSPSDKQGLDTLFYWLEFSSETPIDDVQELRKIYQIL